MSTFRQRGNRKPESPKQKTIPVDLPRDFVLQLDVFREVHHGAPRTRIIQNAVTSMIKKELEDNEGLNRSYEAELARRRRQDLELIEGNSSVANISDLDDDE